MAKLPRSPESKQTKRSLTDLPRIIITHGAVKTLEDLEDVVLRLIGALAELNQEGKITQETKQRYFIILGYRPSNSTENELMKASLLPPIERITRTMRKGKSFIDVVLEQCLPAGYTRRRGRPRLHAKRDHRIYELRAQGKSYGRISIMMDMDRDQVKAACRRESKRWVKLQPAPQLFRSMKKKLLPINIHFRQVAR